MSFFKAWRGTWKNLSNQQNKALKLAIFTILILRDSPFNPYLGGVGGHEKASAQAHAMAVVHTDPLTLTLAVKAVMRKPPPRPMLWQFYTPSL
jgi:hypothetical protein